MESFALFFTCIAIGHIIGDAILQSREMAETKSSSLYVLINHVSTVSCVNGFIAMWFLPPMATIYFVILNAVGHFIIDGSIWNFYKLKAKIKAKRDYDKNLITIKEQNLESLSFEEWLPKWVSRFEYWKDKDFYTCILIDQALHMLCFVWSLEILSR